MTCAGQGRGTTTSLYSTDHARTMATGRLTTLSGSATSAVQDRHRNTSGEIYLLHQMKPDVMIGGGMTSITMVGIMTTSNARTKGGTASHLHHQGTAESAWLPPCVVLVINDNLYGLIFVLSYL